MLQYYIAVPLVLHYIAIDKSLYYNLVPMQIIQLIIINYKIL